MNSVAVRSLAGKSVLVTGGSGFIGTSLCRELQRRGADVHATSRAPLIGSGVTWHTCDVADHRATEKLFRTIGPHLVLHLASHVDGSRTVDAVLPTFRDNLGSTVNVLVAAQKAECERVVLVGSAEEPAPSLDWSVPRSPYAAAKHAAAAYGRMFHALYDLPVTTLRVAMVYGPGQRDTSKLVPYTITSLLSGHPPRFTSGTRQADWIYVDDVVDALIAAAVAPRLGGLTLDVGTGTLTTVRRVVELLYELITPDLVPEFGSLVDRPMDQTEPADIETTFRHLGWRSETSIETGLSRTVSSYRSKPRQESTG